MPARDEPDLDPVLADAVRRAYVRPVDEDIASRHLTAIVAAADEAPQVQAPVAGPSRRRLWRPVLGAGLAATLLLPVGLAAAGVSLPSVVERPYRAVGIALPNQTKSAPVPSAPASDPSSPRTPATAPGTGRPQPSGAPSARRSGAAGKTQGDRSQSTPGSTGSPSRSGRPATAPPPPGSSGSGPKAKVKPVPRRPVVTPAKPSVPRPPGYKKPPGPAKPAPQAARPSPRGGQGLPASPVAPSQNGDVQPRAAPEKRG